MASRGLAFSGIRGKGLSQLAESLATSKLGVDRELAIALLDADIDLKSKILNLTSDLIADAHKGRTEAISQLNKLGYAVIGDVLYEIPKDKNYVSIQGGLFDKDTESWIIPPKESGSSVSDIETYAKDVAMGKITLSSVPNNIQSQVSQRVDQLRETLRVWEDDEIRAAVRTKVGEIEPGLKKANKVKASTKQQLKDTVLADQSLLPEDKKRFLLIIDEFGVN